MTDHRTESLLALALVGCSVVALATCASGSHPRAETGGRPASAQQGAGEPSTGTSTSTSGDPEQPSPGSSGPGRGESGGVATHDGSPAQGRAWGSGPLVPFWKALANVEEGRRRDPVRVLWLGDSHTAADFMTGTVRQELQKGHGASGPGFVRVGVPHYRHDAARIEVGGKWRRSPQQPSRRSTVLDGVFGLCGMRAVPEPNAFATLRVQGGALKAEAPLRWTLVYRAPGAAALQVQLGERRARLEGVGSGTQPGTSELGEFLSAEGAPIRHFAMDGRAGDELRIEHGAGAPEVFGIYADPLEPGVILDTCGIDGARVATLLAWDAEAWQSEVKARRPDLVVLAFGTNEAFDGGSVDRYRTEYRQVVERLRTAVPELPCWVVGPPDARDGSGRAAERVVAITDVQRRAAAELGCGFVSARELMGGDGSFSAWRQASPPLAAADGVHLSGEGYRKLGAELARALLPPPSASPYSGSQLR